MTAPRHLDRLAALVVLVALLGIVAPVAATLWAHRPGHVVCGGCGR